MPRNKSEKPPSYSPAVTAWMIASHSVRALGENSQDQREEEDNLYLAMTNDEQEVWGAMLYTKLDHIAREVYDAAQQK